MSDSLDKRAKIEIQLATYLEIAMVTVDAETLAYLNRRVQELEQKLCEIDD
jgi:hypothetical protein